MRQNLYLLMVSFFFLGSLVGCDSGARIQSLDQDSVVLAFGDSLTHGTGAAEGQSYPARLAELLGKSVINVGIPGELSAAGLKRLPDVLDKYRPTLIVLCHGGNDFLRRLPEEGTSRNLKAMIELIQAQGADVILVGVPKLGFGLNLPKFYATLAEAYKIPFEEEILVDLLGDRSMKSDTIHPNAEGYRLMAEAIYQVINKAQQK